jgi:hypothetical protein
VRPVWIAFLWVPAIKSDAAVPGCGELRASENLAYSVAQLLDSGSDGYLRYCGATSYGDYTTVLSQPPRTRRKLPEERGHP